MKSHVVEKTKEIVTLLFEVWWISGGFGIWSSKDQLLERQGISKNIVVVE
jgi:hypothetical protein